MEPNPKSFPILSYVLTRIPSLGPRFASSPQHDVEQPPSPSHSDASPSRHLFDRMPHIRDPEVIAAMTLAVSDVAQTRSILRTLGHRPDHETIDAAKAKIAEIESTLASYPYLGEKDQESRRHEAEKEKQAYKAVVQLDEMHEAYEKLLKDAEERLVKIYDSAAVGGSNEESMEALPVEEDCEEVVGILQEALGNGIERVDLSGRQLRNLPEAFGRIPGLVVLNLASNQLQVIPDSIAGLEKLEELYLSSNHLESLPDSIGLLHNLKILDVSKNKLSALPDSISHCRSLVELEASFNALTYLPTSIGHELVNLRRLSIQLNKIRSLPTSICEMKSLRILDVHFNELRGLPPAIGRLTKLEVLNLSSNFSDLTELPDTLGDLTNLRELDLSNNQIHALPNTFALLYNLTTVNIDQNPIVVPPKEVVKEGVEAIKTFMGKRWVDGLVEEEKRNMAAAEEHTPPTGWLSRSTSWLNNAVSGVSENVAGYIGSPRKGATDPYLDQPR